MTTHILVEVYKPGRKDRDRRETTGLRENNAE